MLAVFVIAIIIYSIYLKEILRYLIKCLGSNIIYYLLFIKLNNKYSNEQH